MMARARADRGSVLVLGIGLVAVVVVVLAILCDLATLHLHRRSAWLAADAAARAAAQGLDLDHYYTDGRRAGLRLDPIQARHRATRLLTVGEQDRWRLSDLTVRGDLVTVTVTGTVRLPFTGIVRHAGVTVTGDGAARLVHAEPRP